LGFTTLETTHLKKHVPKTTGRRAKKMAMMGVIFREAALHGATAL
jgi:hypothetical protein